MGGSSAGYPAGGLVDCLDKTDTTVKNIYATDEYLDYAERMYDWAQKGYFSADAATNTDSGTAQIAAGNYLGTIIEVSVHMRRIPCPLFQTG